MLDQFGYYKITLSACKNTRSVSVILPNPPPEVSNNVRTKQELASPAQDKDWHSVQDQQRHLQLSRRGWNPAAEAGEDEEGGSGRVRHHENGVSGPGVTHDGSPLRQEARHRQCGPGELPGDSPRM